ncbi:hypothetical protein [Arcobacter cloacae]|uniref:Uncharacterized protein n=1 Tax=Arcobacter cloacae TaxID=1054034 RepID=A0A4V1LVC1_9BACT|nr:hypothetical protein [Arcobacter cloacae]RXJ83575.1 hypothetical protein CRU90_09300 [Arcobacter cloacae]
MRRVYKVLENFVDKIFAKRVLVSVVKVTMVIIFIMAVTSGFKVDFLFNSLFICLLYIFLYVVNEFLKEEIEYLKKRYSNN